MREVRLHPLTHAPTGLPTRRRALALSASRSNPHPQADIIGSLDACIDSGTDDTLFPERLARRLGIDLDTAPAGEVQRAGQGALPVHYASIGLLLTDGFESYEWNAIVGFVPGTLRWPLLGRAGFLEYFDVEFRGLHREVNPVAQPFLSRATGHSSEKNALIWT